MTSSVRMHVRGRLRVKRACQAAIPLPVEVPGNAKTAFASIWCLRRVSCGAASPRLGHAWGALAGHGPPPCTRAARRQAPAWAAARRCARAGARGGDGGRRARGGRAHERRVRRLPDRAGAARGVPAAGRAVPRLARPPRAPMPLDLHVRWAPAAQQPSPPLGALASGKRGKLHWWPYVLIAQSCSFGRRHACAFSVLVAGTCQARWPCPRTTEALPAVTRTSLRARGRAARRMHRSAPILRRPQHGAALPARLGALRPGAPRRLYDRDAARPHAEALLLAQLAAWQLRRMLAQEGAEAAPAAGRAGGLEGRPPFAECLAEHRASTGSCGGPRPGGGGGEGPAPRAGACGAAAEHAGLPGAPRGCGCAGDLAAATRRWACEVAQARAAPCWACLRVMCVERSSFCPCQTELARPSRSCNMCAQGGQ